MKEVKKQEELKKKLSLNKETITNLNQIRGGKMLCTSYSYCSQDAGHCA